MGDWEHVNQIHQNVTNDPQVHDNWIRLYKYIQSQNKDTINLFTISEIIEEYKLLENSQSTIFEDLQFKNE